MAAQCCLKELAACNAAVRRMQHRRIERQKAAGRGFIQGFGSSLRLPPWVWQCCLQQSNRKIDLENFRSTYKVIRV